MENLIKMKFFQNINLKYFSTLQFLRFKLKQHLRILPFIKNNNLKLC
jgi:hypothetical protein